MAVHDMDKLEKASLNYKDLEELKSYFSDSNSKNISSDSINLNSSTQVGGFLLVWQSIEIRL